MFGALGVLLFTTASVGVLSADLAACGVSVFVFGCYHALMMVLIMLQLAALVFYYTNKTHMQGPSSHKGEFLSTCTLCLAFSIFASVSLMIQDHRLQWVHE